MAKKTKRNKKIQNPQLPKRESKYARKDSTLPHTENRVIPFVRFQKVSPSVRRLKAVETILNLVILFSIGYVQFFHREILNLMPVFVQNILTASFFVLFGIEFLTIIYRPRYYHGWSFILTILYLTIAIFPLAYVFKISLWIELFLVTTQKLSDDTAKTVTAIITFLGSGTISAVIVTGILTNFIYDLLKALFEKIIGFIRTTSKKSTEKK